MNNYNGSVLYNEETLRRMGKIQIRSRVIHNVIYLAMCIVLIIAGILFGLKTMPGLLCAAAGGIGIPLLGSVIRARTDNIIKALGNNTIHVSYTFDSTGVSASTGDQSNRILCKDLCMLWEDAEYFYLFYGKVDTLMVSKKSLVPADEAGFRKDIAAITGLTWYQYTSPLMINIRPLLQGLKRTLQNRAR